MGARHRVIGHGGVGTWLRRLQVAGAALLVVCVPLALLADRAAATTGTGTLTSTDGSVTLTTTAPVTLGGPYSSGQTINISVAPNTTLSLANLESNGYTGEPAMKAVECVDPGGLSANLPTNPLNNCDGQTVLSTSAVNADGSFSINGYTVYWLPDNATFGESASNKPTCGTVPNYCVLYIGPNQLDFSKPHIFSAPFAVQNNGDDGGENPGDGSAPPQTGTDATKSTVVATPSLPVADGENVAKVTVSLKDAAGDPVTSTDQVTLSQGAGSNATILYDGSPGTVGTSDPSTGVVNFTVSDTTAEPVTFSATDTTASVPIAETAMVSFVAPVVTAANSNVVASPTTVLSGDTAIIVTLDDQATPPEPVADKTVALHQSGSAAIMTVSATTNAQGQATFTATDASAEAITFTATDTTDGVDVSGSPPAVVTFGNLSVSAGLSTVTANPAVVSSVASGGLLPTGTVTVTLLAPDGHSVVSGKTVTLAASSSTAVIAPSAAGGGAVTDSNGKATFTVSDATAEDVTFTATDTTDRVTISPSQALVHFEKPTASATNSTVTVSTTSDAADGVTPATIVVTMFDQFGHALPGVNLTVAGSPDTTTRVAPQTESTTVPAGTTDSTGSATFLAYDTAAETVTYTATDTTDNIVLPQTVRVTYNATAPQADNSTVTASPDPVAADGSTPSTVTVTLEDHNSNPVPAKTISLAAAAGSSVITAISPTTNTAGQATFGVTDTKNETVMYTATDTTDGLVLAGQAVTVTFGTPPPVEPVIADSAVVAAPTQVPADGSTPSTVTVVLADADGGALAGKTVALNPQGGSSSVTTVTGTTNSDGEATFTVTDKTAETVTYDATDVTDNLPLTGQSITVVFAASAGSSGSGGAASTTSTTSTTPGSTTTAPGSTSSTAPSSATASDAATTGDTGSSAPAAVPASDSSGGSLAFTGASDLLPWVIALGILLLGAGTIGRRQLSRGLPATVRIERDRS